MSETRKEAVRRPAAGGAMNSSVVKHARRIVVKVGSSLVTAEGRGLDHAALSRWAEQIAALTAQGKEVVLVSSGRDCRGHRAAGLEKAPEGGQRTAGRRRRRPDGAGAGL